jgi:hypothetical protein
VLQHHSLVGVSERQHKCTVHPDQVIDLVTKDMVNIGNRVRERV